LAAADQDTQTAPAAQSDQRSPLQVADAAATVTSAAHQPVALAEVITVAPEQLEHQAKATKVETHQAAPMVEEVAAVKVPRPPTWEAITAQTVELAQNGPHPQAPITPEAAEADRIPAAQPVSAA